MQFTVNSALVKLYKSYRSLRYLFETILLSFAIEQPLSISPIQKTKESGYLVFKNNIYKNHSIQ